MPDLFLVTNVRKIWPLKLTSWLGSDETSLEEDLGKTQLFHTNPTGL